MTRDDDSHLLLHVPHASTVITSDERADFLVSDSDLQAELRLMTDWFTDELFAATIPSEQVLQAPQSRLVVDVERFRDDAQEPCARLGRGATYVRTDAGRPLRRLTTARREDLLARYYDPHHARCDDRTRHVVARWGRCLIVDCHSYPTSALSIEEPNSSRPDIGIGTDAFHTPVALVSFTCDFFASRGLTVAIDQPFKGTFVPNAFYQREQSVQSVMSEVRRDLYMDELTGKQSHKFESVQRLLQDYLESVERFSEPRTSTKTISGNGKEARS